MANNNLVLEEAEFLATCIERTAKGLSTSRFDLSAEALLKSRSELTGWVDANYDLLAGTMQMFQYCAGRLQAILGSYLEEQEV